MSEAKVTDQELAQGYVEVELSGGQIVKVRALKLKEFPEYMSVMASNDEIAMIKLTTGEDAGDWIIQDVEAVLSAGERLNGDPFESWRERCRNREELLFPGMRDKLAEAYASKGLAGTSGSRPSPDRPAWVPTGQRKI